MKSDSNIFVGRLLKTILTKLFRLYVYNKKRVSKFIVKYENIEHYRKINISKGKIGNDVKFGKNVVISGCDKVQLNNNIHIGSDSFIRADGGLIIGNNVIISRNVVIYTVSHNYLGSLLPFDTSNIEKPVVIEDNVWIGTNVTISPGTIIGEGAIIAMGSHVYGNIAPLSIVGSGEIKVLKIRDREHYN